MKKIKCNSGGNILKFGNSSKPMSQCVLRAARVSCDIHHVKDSNGDKQQRKPQLEKKLGDKVTKLLQEISIVHIVTNMANPSRKV